MKSSGQLFNWRSHPSAFLLATQLVLLALYALFDDLDGQRVIGSFGLVVLVLIVWVVLHSPAPNWAAWALGVPAFILSLLSVLSWGEAVLGWAALLSALLYFYAAGSLIAYMLSDNVVTTDEVVAAGATFTLLAWGFGELYVTCQAWVPDSFRSSVVAGRPLVFVELLSLSFTNLTATGLSDIVASSSWARVISLLEQFAGIGYVALVVSRLVSLMGKKREHRHIREHHIHQKIRHGEHGEEHP